MGSSGLKMSRGQLLTFFVSYSVKDVFRRKVLYMIAFSAVFFSILSILMIDVFVKKGSLIFVRKSEDLQIDAIIKPGMKGHSLNQAQQRVYTNFRFNMTEIDLMMLQKGNGGKPKHRMSPRIWWECVDEYLERNQAFFSTDEEKHNVWYKTFINVAGTMLPNHDDVYS